MKNIVLTGLAILVINAEVIAAPIYGPTLPEKNKIHAGGQTHYVNEKELEGENGEMESLQHFVLISYGITDWLSLDLKGGAGNIKAKSPDGTTIVYPSYMAGGYGLRLKAYDENKAKIIFGFQHISVHPYSIWIGETKHKGVLDDWQWSMLGSYEFSKIIPYAGFKWATMDYIHWTNGERNLIKSDDDERFGLVAGMDVPINERLRINVEGQFVNSQAASLSIFYKF